MADLTTLEEKLAEATGLAGAGEVGHWAILGKLNEAAGEDEIQELVDWALPIQERHLVTVRDGSLELAAEEDPNS